MERSDARSGTGWSAHRRARPGSFHQGETDRDELRSFAASIQQPAIRRRPSARGRGARSERSSRSCSFFSWRWSRPCRSAPRVGRPPSRRSRSRSAATTPSARSRPPCRRSSTSRSSTRTSPRRWCPTNGSTAESRAPAWWPTRSRARGSAPAPQRPGRSVPGPTARDLETSIQTLDPAAAAALYGALKPRIAQRCQAKGATFVRCEQEIRMSLERLSAPVVTARVAGRDDAPSPTPSSSSRAWARRSCRPARRRSRRSGGRSGRSSVSRSRRSAGRVGESPRSA